MRYFIDTEFIEDGKTIELISIGIVAEDGREYYKQNRAFFGRALYAPKDTPAWIVENVFPHLSPEPMSWVDRTVMKAEITVFMDPERYGKPQLWGWCAGYDWVAFCQLFGTMMQLPAGYPHYIHEVQQSLDERGVSDEMLLHLAPQEEGQAHHALADARYLKKIWEFLMWESLGDVRV